jgi:ABC-type Zn uptake system ZnuABC Zn-binding protein ZnuA
MPRKKSHLLLLPFIILLANACTAQVTPTTNQLPVVATTSILADVVSRVGGNLVSVTTLVPPGVNEHEYQPSPRDIAAVSDAALVFEVGLGLEQFMDTIIRNAAGDITPIEVSNGISAQELLMPHDANTAEQQHEHTTDPHVWLDPANVIVWTENITAALSARDPAGSGTYQANAAAYIAELKALDEWIKSETARIPQEKRLIVTDHMLFNYFAEKYGFTVVGALIPSYSSLAQPSAQEIAALEDAIRQYNVRVILVGNTVNPTLAARVAEDTGTTMVQFYTGSLSNADGPAATYLDYMRFNVKTIVNALSGE